jgi:predicted site-specific integrase-resolvase
MQILLSEVARMAGVSKSTAYRYLQRGIIGKGSYQVNAINGRVWFTASQAQRAKRIIQGVR